ncbi:MAG: hypothetical protein CW716_11545 [Candidatus Bathyarchaeum sp.]|nr:MAG: hypothetical protein CW716_11545 [Candidatus Bathyarchaeum sp.]
MNETKRKNVSVIVLFLAFIILFSSNTVNASTEAEVQSQVTNFLTQVAGFDETSLSFSSFNVSRSTLTESTSQLIINAIITSNNQEFSLAMTFVREKVVFYVLDLLENENSDKTQISVEESLNVAKMSLQAYEKDFDAIYVSEFIQALPTSLSTQESTIENEDSLLNIKYSDVSDTKMEYASFSWIKKIGGITVPNLSVALSVAKNGLVTKFFDNLELYEIVVADDLISEEQAISIGQEYIEKYATENDRKTVAVVSKFQYSRDFKCTRGDSYTLYPQWAISANFSEIGKEGVYGYSVLIWADTGEVHSFEPQGTFLDKSLMNETPSNSVPMMIGITLTLTLAIVAIYLYKRKHIEAKIKVRNSVIRKTSVLLTIAFLCSLPMLQVCNASSSMIFGSRASLPDYEIEIDTTLAGNIASASSAAGYDTYNWYGSSTTRNNLYIGAYGYGEFFSHSFFVGHGDGGSSSGWWCFVWPWHYHDTIAMYDDSGNWIRDHDIFWNSFSVNINSRKAVVFWSCHLGEDAIGSVIEHPCRTEYHAMPQAWNHDLSLSLNGYNNPDSSGQAFIGWIGTAPFLSSDLFDVEDMGYNFLLRFYWATMVDGRTINAGLDYASNDLFGVSYGNCDLYIGFGGSQMLVYGQGSIYL